MVGIGLRKLVGGVAVLFFSSCVFLGDYEARESEPVPWEGDGEGSCEICEVCGLEEEHCSALSCSFASLWEDIRDGAMSCDELLVVAEDGDDEADGTAESPVRTIGEALSRGRRMIALMGDGVWEEALRIERGVTIIGGLSWAHSAEESRPLLKVVGQGAHVSGLEVIGVDSKVTLTGFDIEVMGGMTNYGLRIIDSSLVELRNMQIVAGDGGPGASGKPGEEGARGSVGENGGVITVSRAGAGGVNMSCPEANGGSGGQGGQSSLAPHKGEDSPGGALGRWGEGDSGADGARGRDGGAGGPGGLPLDGVWVSQSGEDGDDGGHGSGGAGGSGGDAKGATGGGGGGGAGGCGGGGGGGGEGGGSSLGVFVQNSQVQIVGSIIQAGYGGAGGAGAPGGKGGAGAAVVPERMVASQAIVEEREGTAAREVAGEMGEGDLVLRWSAPGKWR